MDKDILHCPSDFPNKHDKPEDYEQGLRCGQFVAPMIKAVQELKARVEELESAP